MGKHLRKTTLAVVLAASVYAAMKAVGATEDQVRRDVVRQFNKHLLNPFAMWVAARRPMYYGIVHHTGRRSGKSYSTPVVAKPVPEGLLIPLPYGVDTDWCKNVIAAGTCTLTLNGQEYALNSPEILAASAAERLVRPADAAVWRRLGIKHYLVMKRSVAAQAGESLQRVAA